MNLFYLLLFLIFIWLIFGIVKGYFSWFTHHLPTVPEIKGEIGGEIGGEIEGEIGGEIKDRGLLEKVTIELPAGREIKEEVKEEIRKEVELPIEKVEKEEKEIKLPVEIFDESFVTKSIARYKNSSRGEAVCRCVLEHIYGVDFPNVRPNFLRNPETGRNLELDCYNEQLKLAVEYNGEQHYRFVDAFHNDISDLEKQKKRDLLKMQLCKENNVTLIIVPYTVPLKSIAKYLVSNIKGCQQEYQ